MDKLLALIAMVAGIGAGTIALVSSMKQPDKARQLRGMSVMFFGIALAMVVVFFI